MSSLLMGFIVLLKPFFEIFNNFAIHVEFIVYRNVDVNIIDELIKEFLIGDK